MEEYYLNDGVSRTIEEGVLHGYKYMIRTVRGTHPCAYVVIPDGHIIKEYVDKWLDEINEGDWSYSEYELIEMHTNIHVHGGLTYGNRNVIGWDYAHCDDYAPIYDEGGKKWTRDEIMRDIEQVIYELADFQHYAEPITNN